MGDQENARRSVSRVLYLQELDSRGDGHSSGTPVTGRLVQPTRTAARKPACPLDRNPAGAPSLFGLAPGGVYPAASVTSRAVRSYRTLSPLPIALPFLAEPAGGLLSVALSLGSPPPGVTRHRVSVEPGLSSIRARKRKQQPSDRLAGAL